MKIRINLIYLVVMVLLVNKSNGEGQSLNFTTTTYISIGGNFTYHFGKAQYISLGPEIAYGYVYSDPFITSANFGVEFFTKKGGFELFSKIQYGSWMLGGSTGVVYMYRDQKSRIGIQWDIWAGAATYLMASFLFIQDYSGFSTTGKIKVPIPLSQPSNPNFRPLWN